jgi:ferric-dicitrate binding protein FerR (iron transport regulator)
MAPGDMALFDREAGEVSLSKISTDNFRPFTEGRSFSFFNAPLRDIAASLQRGFGRRIVIGDAGIQDTRYLAFFTNGESLDDILKLLCKNGNLRVVHSDNTIYLYGKNH